MPDMLAAAGIAPDLIIVNGCTFLMMRTSELTRPLGWKTIVNMNPIMIDGTGMCGVCRLSVGGKMKFACVDGPDFDGHEIDWESSWPGARATIPKRSIRCAGAAAPRTSEPGRAPRGRRERKVADEQTTKKKLDLLRRPMPKQDPYERVKNFDEVALGYPVATAREEASRCLDCKKPRCATRAVPSASTSPASSSASSRATSPPGIRKIKETNALPAICGRVCPQEEQCEKMCVLGKKGEPVAIGRLERFLADWEAERGKIEIPKLAPKTGKKVAIVGAGPAGVTVANDLAHPRPRRDDLRGPARVRGAS